MRRGEKRLTRHQVDLIDLILRSPDLGDGSRNVSKLLWPLVSRDHRLPEEIAEYSTYQLAGGGEVHRVRLTDFGQRLLGYL